MVKKQKPIKGLGARYGIKPRKQFTQIHHLMKSQRKCPECGGSVSTDIKFYPENPTKTKITFNKKIKIEIESDQIPHLRANLNSTLRLIQASYDSINSVKI